MALVPNVVQPLTLPAATETAISGASQPVRVCSCPWISFHAIFHRLGMAGWDDHESVEATVPSVSGGLLDVIVNDYGPV